MDGQEERLGQTEGAPRRGPGRPPLRRDHADERILAERGQQEREITEDRDLSDQERLEMFRDAQYQSVLPDLPLMPGYHGCWLTTSNPRDSIQQRLRLGYELLKLEDTAGWEGIALKSGDYAGVIAINEMVAARIPLRLYNIYLKEAHHNAPLREEEKLIAQVRQLAEDAQTRGTVIDQGEGMQGIVQRAKPMPELHE